MTVLESLVTIRVDYSNADEAEITVEPEEVEIFYNRRGGPDRSDLPRTVRWDVHGIREGDRVVVRPKASLDAKLKRLLSPPDGERLEATSANATIRCEPPDCRGSWTFPLKWEYEAAVHRRRREIGALDPIVLIKEDP